MLLDVVFLSPELFFLFSFFLLLLFGTGKIQRPVAEFQTVRLLHEYSLRAEKNVLKSNETRMKEYMERMYSPTEPFISTKRLVRFGEDFIDLTTCFLKYGHNLQEFFTEKRKKVFGLSGGRNPPYLGINSSLIEEAHRLRAQGKNFNPRDFFPFEFAQKPDSPYVCSLSRAPQRKGPNYTVSALNEWRITLCVLSLFLVFDSSCFSFSQNDFLLSGPLGNGVSLGRCFQKNVSSRTLCIVLLRTSALILRVSHGWFQKRAVWQTEYIYLSLLALLGGYFLILATDLRAVYLCLELQRFSLIVLCASHSKNKNKTAYSLEAAIKYFLLSAFRSCLFLLGSSFLYLDTGETSLIALHKIFARLSQSPREDERKSLTPLLFASLGIWLVTLSILLKLAVAPLHLWVPDVLIGALSSVSLWITLVPKIAVLAFWTNSWRPLWSFSSFFLEKRIESNRVHENMTNLLPSQSFLFFGFGERNSNFNFLRRVRALSLIVGRIAPLGQSNLKRLLAYSSVGHIGLMLLPLCRKSGNAEVFFQKERRDSLSHSESSFAEKWVPFSFENGTSSLSPDISLRVLWSYFFLYILLNIGVWGLLMWPLYRPNPSPSPSLHSKLLEFECRRDVPQRDFMTQKERKQKAFFDFYKKTKSSEKPTTPSFALESQRPSPRPCSLWDLTALKRSSPFVARRWAIFRRSLAGLPPFYPFLRKRRILWNRTNNGQYFLVFLSLLYTLFASFYYLKIIKVCFLEKTPSWRSYGKTSQRTAYILSCSLFFMILGLWHGNLLFLARHLLSLSTSSF